MNAPGTILRGRAALTADTNVSASEQPSRIRRQV